MPLACSLVVVLSIFAAGPEAEQPAPRALEPPEYAALARASYRFEPNAAANVTLAQDQAEPVLDDPPPTPGIPTAFGLEGSRRWHVHVGGGTSFKNSDLVLAGAGVSYFLADDLSIDFELNGAYIHQPIDDAVGVNVALLMRWHFYHDEARSWSLYADGGAGLLVTTEEVPIGGSQFNFTPQLGAGVSFDLGDDDARLFAGVRWYHISNANVYDHNPGLDDFLFYTMLSFPF